MNFNSHSAPEGLLDLRPTSFINACERLVQELSTRTWKCVTPKLPNFRGDVFLWVLLNGDRELVTCGAFRAVLLSSIPHDITPATHVAGLRSTLHRLEWIRAIAELCLQQFGDLLFFGRDLVATLSHTSHWPSSEVIKYIKYYTIAPQWKFFSKGGSFSDLNLPPDCPDGAPKNSYRILRGKLGRYFNQLMVSRSKGKSAAFFQSWHQLKGGTRSLDESDLEASYVKHGSILSVAPVRPVDPRFSEDCERKLRAIWRGCRLDFKPDDPINYQLSNSASFATSRKHGGCSAEVRALWSYHASGLSQSTQLVDRIRNFQSGYINFRFFDQEGRFYSDPASAIRAIGVKPVVPDPLSDLGLLQAMRDTLDEDTPRQTHVYPPVLEPKLCSNGNVDHVLTNQIGFRPYNLRELIDMSCYMAHDGIRVASVFEPLKIRNVSCGDALTYSTSMPAQRSMHRHLYGKPQFSLIGQPMGSPYHKGPSPMSWLFSQTRAFGDKYGLDLYTDDTFWVSGDYEAATDRLDIRFTKMSHEIMMNSWAKPERDQDLFTSFKEVCRHVLYEQYITYPTVRRPNGSKYEQPAFLQKNGQLMGSTLSFPHLSALNILPLWKAWETYLGRPLPLSEIPVLVNGDDIGFRANRAVYELWKANCDVFGFKQSAGKNLVHKNILILNSKQWRSSEKGFFPLGQFSVKLLLNKKKTGSCEIDTEGETPNGLAPRHNKLLAEGTGFDQARLTSRYISVNQVEIQRQTCGGLINLFGDTTLGSVGFKRPPSFQVEFTRFQRRLAFERTRQYDGVVMEKLQLPRRPGIYSSLIPCSANAKVEQDGLVALITADDRGAYPCLEREDVAISFDTDLAYIPKGSDETIPNSDVGFLSWARYVQGVKDGWETNFQPEFALKNPRPRVSCKTGWCGFMAEESDFEVAWKQVKLKRSPSA